MALYKCQLLVLFVTEYLEYHIVNLAKRNLTNERHPAQAKVIC